MKTTVERIAREELETLLAGEEARLELAPETREERVMTVQDALDVRALQLKNNTRLKSRSRRYWEQTTNWVNRSWPALAKLEIRQVTQAQCEAWAGKYCKVASPNLFNNAIGLLKNLFQIGIERGARRTNPMAAVKRVKLRTKDLSSRLPSREQFGAFLTEMRNGRSRFSRHCADLVEFLAYTGLRIGEAEFVLWGHCDFKRGEILVVGDPVEATKNSEFRRVPMISAARDLLERLKGEREFSEPKDRLLIVNEAQKSMDRAGKKVGIERITHHDLRHFFATICIESGVDIPTVSRWLGHKDGGALAMKVYGHLRNEHSQAAAARVSFAV